MAKFIKVVAISERDFCDTMINVDRIDTVFRVSEDVCEIVQFNNNEDLRVIQIAMSFEDLMTLLEVVEI